MSVEVVPATSAQWDDVAAIFTGRTGPNACWCQRFRHHDYENNQLALRQEIDAASVPIGLVAYVDQSPAGWSRVVPRRDLPGVVDNAALRRLYENDRYGTSAAWWVSCFAVRRAHRGNGVGVALLRAAAEFARGQGASVLDGHPVDVERLRASPSPSALFTGTRTMFLAAGFTEIGRTYVSRPVMRMHLD
jgi:GNAT superfamily N-acetyltransferase